MTVGQGLPIQSNHFDVKPALYTSNPVNQDSQGLRFRVLGFRVWEGFGVWGFRNLGAKVLGFRVEGLGDLEIKVLGFRVQGLGV